MEARTSVTILVIKQPPVITNHLVGVRFLVINLLVTILSDDESDRIHLLHDNISHMEGLV